MPLTQLRRDIIYDIKSVFMAFLDFFFPRYCLMCGRTLDTWESSICIHCNMELPRTFLWREPQTNSLAKRFYGKARLEKAAAYVYYNSHSDTANIIYAFKYKNEPYTAVNMGKMLAQELLTTNFFDGIDSLIPVPLNKKKLRKRGYNQSEMLAKGISQVTGIEVMTKSLLRNKDTVSQTKMKGTDRQDNMEDVFEITKHAHCLAGKHCLLIDDIITTGATVASCAQELSRVENIKLSVLAFGCVKDIK